MRPNSVTHIASSARARSRTQIEAAFPSANRRISRVGFARLLAAVLCCGLLAAAYAQTNYQQLRSFGFSGLGEAYPEGSLIQGKDGNLYGTTAGTVFKLNPNGSGYAVLHRFDNVADGIHLSGSLLQASDGILYGTTTRGGILYDQSIDAWGGFGTVFKLNPDGSGYAVLYRFSAYTGEDGRWDGDGFNPLGRLVEGSDGALYGTTVRGGARGSGTVFKVNKDGSSFATLHVFSNSNEEGGNPEAGLTLGSDGALYGTTTIAGNTNNWGTIFRLNQDGSAFTVLRRFDRNGEDEYYPAAPLLEGSDGALYGTTLYGGITESVTGYSFGTVFRLNKDGNGYRVLRRFTGLANGDGWEPWAGLVEGNDGALYGTTKYGGTNDGFGAGTVFKLNKDGSDYAVLRRFTGSGGDGAEPQTGLLRTADGSLYGTTMGGGIFYGNSSHGYGTLFKLNPDGTAYAVLRRFNEGVIGDGAESGNGFYPAVALVQGSDGALYGTTPLGGAANLGTVFTLNPDGSAYRILHSFAGRDGDGRNPQASVVEGSDGALYGTTAYGGLSGLYSPYGYGNGTVFRLNKDGSDYRVLRRFTNIDSQGRGDGNNPAASLVEGSDGALYGTTVSGGSNTFGTVFRLNRDGSGYSILRHLSLDDGGTPAGLVRGSDGTLYGITHETIFKLNQDGSGYTVLHRLTQRDGGVRLVEGNDGALYAITAHGGIADYGTVLKLNKDGSGSVVLHEFGGSESDGYWPIGLLQARDGTLYGSTTHGGTNSGGTIFKLNSDGTAYTVIRSFAAWDGWWPGGLMQGSDDALYGTTTAFFGTIFRLFSSPPVVAISRIELAGAGARLTLSGGAANQTFQLQATTNLRPLIWQTIGTNQFGTDGKFQFLDTGASNYPTRFYRSAMP